MRCEIHHLEDDYNLAERPCKSCGLPNVLNHENVCRFCEPTTFKNYVKRKENRVRLLLEKNGLCFTHADKIVDAKCGLERPDFVFEMATHVVILEVDENQHKSYPCECEQVRMVNVTQAYGGLHVFWIRYNPDAFKGCSTTLTDNDREKHLLDWVKWSLEHIPSQLAEVVYLFYDGCDKVSKASEIQILIAMNV